MTFQWTQEDTQVWNSLADGGYITEEDSWSVLTVVNAARAYERDRIVTLLRTLPAPQQTYLALILAWLEIGAPDAV
jgi:hypothetical protein